MKAINLLFISYAVFILNFVFINGACTTIPVSLSNVTNCINNVCTFTQIANFVMNTPRGSQSCLQFVSPDGSTESYPININVLDSEFVYNLEYYYWTDSPKITSYGLCGCPGGHDYNVNNCPISNSKFGQYTTIISTDGVHSNSYCALNAIGKFLKVAQTHGTYCFKMSLEGYNRFKIMKWRPIVNKNIFIEISAPNISTSINYHGIPTFAEFEDAPFNITVLSDTAFSSFNPYATLYDNHDARGFYFLGPNEVNGINEYSTNKIGWFKPNETQSVGNGLGNQLDVKIVNCKNDILQAMVPWNNLEDLLADYQALLNGVVSPYAYIVDGFYENYIDLASQEGDIPSHTIEPYDYFFDNGFQILDENSIPLTFGEDEDGNIIPSVTSTEPSSFSGYLNIEIDFLDGYSSMTPQQASDAGIKLFYSTATNIPSYYINYTTNTLYKGPIRNVYSMQGGLLKSFCVYTDQDQCNTLTGTCTHTLKCSDWCFIGLNFPTYQYMYYCYRNSTLSATPVGLPSPVDNAPNELHIPINNGAINMQIAFINQTIVFKNSLIVPIIEDIKNSDNTLIITARSSSVPGECFVSVDPDNMLMTQSIALTTNNKDYSLTLLPTRLNKRIYVIIMCYQNMVKGSITVNYDVSIKGLSQENITTTPCPGCDEYTINFDKVGGQSTWDKFKGFFKNLFNGTATWWHYIMLVLIILGAMLIIGLLFYFGIIQWFVVSILKLFKWIFESIWSLIKLPFIKIRDWYRNRKLKSLQNKQQTVVSDNKKTDVEIPDDQNSSSAKPVEDHDDIDPSLMKAFKTLVKNSQLTHRNVQFKDKNDVREIEPNKNNKNKEQSSKTLGVKRDR